jgi:hypothetical protein
VPKVQGDGAEARPVREGVDASEAVPGGVTG